MFIINIKRLPNIVFFQKHLSNNKKQKIVIGCKSGGLLRCLNDGKCLNDGSCECRSSFKGLTCACK